MHILKKYVISSLILHLVLLVLMCWMGSGSHLLKRRYIVFGAHSGRPNRVSYKSSHLFARNQIGRGIGGSGKIGACKRGGKGTGARGRVQKQKSAITGKTSQGKNIKKSSIPSRHKNFKKIKQGKTSGPVIKDLSKKQQALEIRRQREKTKREKRHKQQLARNKQKQLKQKRLKAERLKRRQQEEEARAQEEEQKEQERLEAQRQQEQEAREAQEAFLKEQKEKEDSKKLVAMNDESNDDTSNNDNSDDGDGQEGDAIGIEVHASPVEEAEFNVNTAVYQKNIQQEVERLWHPPVGVVKGTTCTLLLDVDLQGKIAKTELVARSKVLIYDLSVIKIAKKFAFNKSLWGKQFKIDFRQ